MQTLEYNRYRYYDQLTGQYVVSDLIGLGGGERPFGYVAIPITWVDPLGLRSGLETNVDPSSPTTTHSIDGNRSSKVVQDITSNMRKNGFGDNPLDVTTINGRKYVVDGHHRLAAAKRAGVNVDTLEKKPSDLFSPGGYRDEQDVINSAASAGPNRLRP